ncbi:MAG: hypothetical protein IKP86_06370 [Anaerolineaceae bacterium]|nr:hypothetical protein [Anaerolineaceae bacterium]
MKKTIVIFMLAAVLLITGNCFADGRYVGNCPMKSYLSPGDHAEVPMKTGLKIRKEPAGEETGVQAFYGKDIRILDGPVCKNGTVWFEIDFLGTRGWSMEGKDGSYYLKKTNGSPTIADPSGPSYSYDGWKVGSCKYYTKLSTGSNAKVVNTRRLQMYRTAGGISMNKDASEGSIVSIINGPKCVDGTVWWEINLRGTSGWVMEMSSSGKYYLEKQ